MKHPVQPSFVHAQTDGKANIVKEKPTTVIILHARIWVFVDHYWTIIPVNVLMIVIMVVTVSTQPRELLSIK